MKWEFLGKQEHRDSTLPRKGHTYSTSMWRTPVPGGWLILAVNSNSNDPQPLISFYPDPEHYWTGNSPEGAEYLLRPAGEGESTPSNQLLRPGPDEIPPTKRLKS